MSHHRKFVVSSDIQQRFSPSLTKRAPNKLPVQDAFEDDQIGHSPMLQRYSKFNTSVMKYPNPIAIAQRFTTVNKSRKKGSSPKTTLDSVFVRRNEDSPIETVEISSVVENCNIVISVPNDKPTENWLLLDSNLPLNSNPINYGDLAAAIESTDNLDMNENHKNSPRMSVSRGTTTSTLNSLRRGRSLTHGKLNLYKTPSLQDSLNSSYRGYSQSEPKLRPQPAKPAVFDLFGNNNKSDDCCCHCAKQATPDLISDSPNVIRLSIDKGSPSIVRHLKCPNSILKSSKTREEPSVSLEFNCETQVSPDGKNIEEIGSDDGIVVTTPSATIPAIRISSACSLSTANSDETLATADPFEVQTVTVVADFDESDWEMPESPKSQLDTSDSTPTYESLTSRSHTPAAESLSSGSLYQHSLRNSLKSRFQSCPDLLEPCLNDFKPELNLLDRAKRKKKSRAKPSRSEYSWEGKPLAAWKLDDILVWLQHLGLDELASVLIGESVVSGKIRTNVRFASVDTTVIFRL